MFFVIYLEVCKLESMVAIDFPIMFINLSMRFIGFSMMIINFFIAVIH